MFTILTASQVNQIEGERFASGDRQQHALMETAGKAATVSILNWVSKSSCSTPPGIHVLCGPGNNGGDGYVVARLLRENGYPVRVYSYGDSSRLSAAAESMRQKWLACGPVGELCELAPTEVSRNDIVVDALFGIGLSRPLRPDLVAALSRVPASASTIAIDIRSGIHAGTGRALLPAGSSLPPACMTVAFHCAKPGHFLGDGATMAGRLEVVSIGLEAEFKRIRQQWNSELHAYTLSDLRTLQVPVKKAGQHKYDHGHVLVLAGGSGRGGAARLAARAALRVGAGLVTVGVPAEAIVENAAQLNAIMIARVGSPHELAAAIGGRRIDAMCIGPGIGVNVNTRRLIRIALATDLGVVLDADALTSFERRADDLLSKVHERTVLTPHHGEFRRLFPDLGRKLAASEQMSKVEATVRASRRSNCTVLLKGHDTVIADPSGKTCICSSVDEPAAAQLATAGAGDVLSGLISGLMARNMRPFEACRLAALLHAASAVDVGPGLIAEDLPRAAGRILGRLSLRAMGESCKAAA
ncbi:MAG: NAD(P)H-hydrate dehydratase [Rhodobacteraceae bacterium]|nr:NAD(P)H-hydrate dehydratase [Paracoccaceae bacterium]